MTVSWFDPISQRMRRMPADKPPVEIHEPAVKEGLSAEHKRIWSALVSTAASSTMAAPAEEEEICF